MEPYNLLVVSDLHLCEGFDPRSGKMSRTEDFLFDGAFARFLDYHERVKHQPRFEGRPWLLVLAGDLFEFLQVVALPREGRELRVVKGVDTYDKLRPNEREFGLGTTARESEWKLKRIARGHQPFFSALGRFIAHGNRVAVIKGNHDIDLYWPEVQDRFVIEVKRAYTRWRLATGEGEPITFEKVERAIDFYPWFFYESDHVYIEHGGQYDTANHFPDFISPTMPSDSKRLLLPWGSLFVRYLFNKVEDVHPFADNIKPMTRYMGWAIRENPGKTFYLLATRGWVFLRAFFNVAEKEVERAIERARHRADNESIDHCPLPTEIVSQLQVLARRQVQRSEGIGFGAVLYNLPALIAVGLILASVWSLWQGDFGNAGLLLLGAAAAYVLRWVLKRHFESPFEHFLLRTARKIEQILAPDHAVPYIVMGHDHQPALERLEEGWYVNTGAWVPLYDEDGPIAGREKLSFLRLPWGNQGTPDLLHWNDGARAPERLVIWHEEQT